MREEEQLKRLQIKLEEAVKGGSGKLIKEDVALETQWGHS